MAKNWTDILDAVIVPTGEERTVTEYRDKDGVTWYSYNPNIPAANKRQIRQRFMKQTEVDGKVSYYWETLGTEGSK